MRKLACQGKVRYWALGISVAVHAAGLAVFTGVKLSNLQDREQLGKPSVSMQMVKRVIEEPKPLPKPKVETIIPSEPEVRPALEPAAKPLVIESKKPAALKSEPPPVVQAVSTAPVETVHEVEFFGQKSIVQRICYVVDCSGSMYGQMYRVKSQLKKSISGLNPQQTFCILFFMEGRQVLMTGSGRLESATVETKSQAYELVNKVKPSGSTDAAHALECAMRLRDLQQHSPEVIYFLTDGFDLDERDSKLFVEKVDSLRKILAPSAVLHTIGFWPQERDRRMLQQLAGDTGGEYIEAKLE